MQDLQPTCFDELLAEPDLNAIMNSWTLFGRAHAE
jgi:hypothetical protein